MKKILALACALTFNVVSAQIPTNLDSALIACYPFNGNATDASGNGNNGVINGAVAVSDRFGNPNSAYSFNGTNQNISVPAFNTKIHSNEFSISFWSTSTIYATRSAFLLVNDDPSNRLNVHIYYGNAFSNSQTFFDWGDIYSNGRLYIAGSPLPATSSWDHWVFTNSAVGNTMKCYKNGVLASTHIPGGNFSPVSTSPRDLLIGGGVGTGSSYLWFDGKLDDIRIYGRELNQADVNALYTRTSACGQVVVTSISTENKSGLEYSVYPNPTSSLLHVATPKEEKTELTIRSVSGSIVKTVNSEDGNADINISDLSAGIYFLNIRNVEGIQVEKIIKE